MRHISETHIHKAGPFCLSSSGTKNSHKHKQKRTHSVNGVFSILIHRMCVRTNFNETLSYTCMYSIHQLLSVIFCAPHITVCDKVDFDKYRFGQICRRLVCSHDCVGYVGLSNTLFYVLSIYMYIYMSMRM